MIQYLLGIGGIILLKSSQDIPLIGLLIATLIGVWYYQKKSERELEEKAKYSEAVTSGAKELFTDHYQVYEVPKRLKYSMKIPEFRELIKSLEFIEKYDKEKLNLIKAYCENFFKIHFNLVLGKYEANLYEQELHLMKEKALEVMDMFIFVLPKHSQIVNITDIDEFIHKKTMLLNAILTKYIDIYQHQKLKGYKDKTL